MLRSRSRRRSRSARVLVPILPYLTPLAQIPALFVSLALAVAGLFAVGALAGRGWPHRNPILRGLEIVAFGAVVFGVSYVAGRFIPPLFGRGGS